MNEEYYPQNDNEATEYNFGNYSQPEDETNWQPEDNGYYWEPSKSLVNIVSVCVIALIALYILIPYIQYNWATRSSYDDTDDTEVEVVEEYDYEY